MVENLQRPTSWSTAVAVMEAAAVAAAQAEEAADSTAAGTQTQLQLGEGAAESRFGDLAQLAALICLASLIQKFSFESNRG